MFVRWVSDPEKGDVILSEGRPIPYGSKDELVRICETLAKQRVAFSVAGMAGPGPADLMEWWQDEGRVAISFLKIAWRNPDEWQVHETAPGVKSWEICSMDELLEKPPTTLMGSSHEL